MGALDRLHLVTEDDTQFNGDAQQLVSIIARSTYDILEDDSSINIPEIDREILSLYKIDSLGRMRVEFTDHTWGIIDKNHKWIHPPIGKEIFWIHETDQNGGIIVNYTDKTQGYLGSNGEWLVGANQKEVIEIQAIEQDGKRRIRFIDKSYGLLGHDGKLVTITTLNQKNILPSGYKISTGEDGTKYVLNPDGSWRIFSPTEYIQEIVGVSELQKDGSRLIQTRGKYHFIISENGDIIQIPDMRTEEGWRIPEFSELKLHKRKINEYEFRGNYWLIRTNEFFYLGIRSDGTVLDSFASGTIRNINRVDIDDRSVLSLGYGEGKRLINANGSLYEGPDGQIRIIDTFMISEIGIRLIQFENNTSIVINQQGEVLKDQNGNNITDIDIKGNDQRYLVTCSNNTYGLLDHQGKWILNGYLKIGNPGVNNWRIMNHPEGGISILREDGTIFVCPNHKQGIIHPCTYTFGKYIEIPFTDGTIGFVDNEENWILDYEGKELIGIHNKKARFSIYGHIIIDLSGGEHAILGLNGTWAYPPDGRAIEEVRVTYNNRVGVTFTDGSTGYYYDNGTWKIIEGEK